MSRTSTGPFFDLQNVTIGAVSLPEGATQALADLEAGAEYEGSWFDEMGSRIFTTLDEMKYKPAGDHLVGRNIETELLAGLESLTAIRDDEEQSPPLRAAVIPEITKLELRLAQREFMKPLRDPMWGADIMDLITRIAPHDVYNSRFDPVTKLTVVTMTTIAIDISTLTVEVDDYGEVCAWIYSEGEL